MTDSLVSLAVVVAANLAASGVGRALLRVIGFGRMQASEAWAWSLLVGFPAVAWMLLVIGLLGLLSSAVLGVLTLSAAFWALGESLLAGGEVPLNRSGSDGAAAFPRNGRSLGLIVLGGAAIASAAALLISASLPLTDSAELMRCFKAPNQWLWDRRIAWNSLARHGALHWPALVWNAWTTALDGVVAARLLAAEFGVLLALAVWLLAKPILPRRGAWAAAWIALLVPGMHTCSATPDGVVATAALSVAALAAWWRAAVDGGNAAWLAIAGGLLATAGMLDPIAWCMALGLVPAWLAAARLRHAPWRDTACEAGLFGATLIVGSGPVLMLTGPLESSAEVTGATVAGSPLSLIASIVGVGSLVLAMSPALLFARRLRGLPLIGLVIAGQAAGAAVCWAVGCPIALWTLAPLWAIPAAWAWCECERLPSGARIAFVASAAASAALCAWPAWVGVGDACRVVLGLQTRDDFLAEACPPYRAAQLTNEMRWPNTRVLSEEPCTCYFDQPAAYAEMPTDRLLLDPSYTHVLVRERIDEQGQVRESPLGRAVRSRRADDGPTRPAKLIQYSFPAETTAWRYELYLLR